MEVASGFLIENLGGGKNALGDFRTSPITVIPNQFPSVMLYFFKINRMLMWSSNGQRSLLCRNIQDNAACR
jgi:hypothetical protein